MSCVDLNVIDCLKQAVIAELNLVLQAVEGIPKGTYP